MFCVSMDFTVFMLANGWINMKKILQHKLLRDGELVLEFSDSLDVLKYIHKTHSYSLDHALKYEGYELQFNSRQGESND